MLLTSPDKELVSSLPLFKGLRPEELGDLLNSAFLRRCPPGTLLFEEGSEPNELLVLIGGTAELFFTGKGREWGVMLLNAGDLLLPGSVLFSEPYLTSARALGFCRMLVIDAEQVRFEAAATARLALNLGRTITGQFRAAMRQLLDLQSRSAAQRLGSFLLKIVDAAAFPPAVLPISKRSLAARLGMTPETLSRTLQVVADNGLVVRGREIIVRDRSRIEAFCGSDPYRPETQQRLEVHVL